MLFALAIPGSAFLLGALHTPVLCVIAAILASAAFLSWFPASPTSSRLPATILVVSGIALTAFTALQALPLPAHLVRILSPSTADVWSGALTPMREPGPAWTTLSLDPGATRVQVLRGFAYLTAFLLTLRLCDRRGGSRFVSVVIIATALGLALAAALHPMFGAEKVFGVYRPESTIADRHIAPLLNPNHLAAYLNIGFCLALGMSLDRRSERLRPIAIALALLLGATQIWVASRGGLLALVFGAACTLLLARTSRRFTPGVATRVMLPALIVAAGLAMIVAGLSPDAVDELNSRDVSKVQMALDGLRLVPHHALFGVGRGAFEVAFPAVRTHLGYSVLTHPENIFVQWITEWGVPVGLAAFVSLGVALRPGVLAVSAAPSVGPWAAIATTLVHNVVDFNSEVPAIGIALAACAAMVVAGHGHERSGLIHQWGRHPRALAGGIASCAVVLIAVAIIGWPHELDEDRRALFDGVNGHEPSDDFASHSRAALLRHPSEPYIPFIASVDASRRGRSVLPWVERSLTLAPIYGPAHFVLAQQLAPLSPSQARLEYRLAITQAHDLPLGTRAVDLGAALVGDFDDALELVPDKFPLRGRVLSQLVRTLEKPLPATSERLEALLQKGEPDSRAVLDRSLQNTMADLEAGHAAPWCDGEYACVEEGLATASRIRAMDPGACGPMIAVARLLIAANRPADGLHTLRESAQTATDPTECWKGLGNLALLSKNDVYIQVAEEEVGRAGCSSDAECANNLLWIGGLEQSRGNPRKAVGFYQRAHERVPEQKDVTERWATLAAELGMHAQALDAFRALETVNPDPKWQAAADREKAAVFNERGVR